MWRQVELTIVQGKNLGLTRYDGANTNFEFDGLEIDLSCEIHLNDILCSRTTVKKGSGSPDWHENFTFPDLPPFESLDIIVWREKRMSKPSVLGITRIALGNFRRGDAVEGWFPVINGGAIGTEIQVGKLRLKICVDE
jgi:C2 domain